MNVRYRQNGMSALNMLLVLMLISFLATCVIKLLPHYMDSWTLNSAIERSIENNEYKDIGAAQIRSKIGKYFDINRIEAIKASDLKIQKEKGVTTIDASYEVRVDFMFNLDVVIKFDALVYTF